MANYVQGQLAMQGRVPLQLEGGVYPAGPVKEAIGQVFGACFMMSIALAFGLGNILLPANIALLIQENRGTVIMVGFALNMIASSLLQTGAFEVYFDDELVYSKLETGQIPSSSIVVSKIRSLLAKSPR
mmetsp:Transcript_74158/g.86040  ORF Transcript_74158/g.86040 Transcript_74158/m.86040 type:complete len:129 (-) Transcript_74158:289-675(-)|eukprot:CAMPEP_0176432232 /NCGR_PEP_ID=MMETSP0127-20121128/15272_1 /TAXON_ID=938130 /ORGANISM="Platyophrya macrostoma, Strain WH" /LENGTH=128 /DNA_ID=CAMNT_0017814365 /DNA_START=317 /DNA_END=703 /DNA_ORIENTATION=+